jgi:hypothetical protein
VGTTTRTAGGRFGSDYHPLELYGVVRDVALTAAPSDPTSVSESVWDGARADAGHEDAPTARAICMRLADGAGRAFPWRELLELVFDESRDIERTHAQRAGATADESLGETHVYYALRRIALTELGQTSLRPDEYQRERERLIAEARRHRGRSPSPELIIELLPTVGQVVRIAENWDKALEIAELEPRQTPTKGSRIEPAVPIADVLDRFADEANGWFCRRPQLLDYARERGIVMAARAAGSSWADYISEAAAVREARGALVRGLPPAGIFPTCRPLESGDTAAEDTAAEDTAAEDAAPETGDSEPTSKMANAEANERPATRADKPRDYWTLERCVAAVRRYYDDPTTNGTHSQARYRSWAAGRPDAPSPSTFGQYGGWKKVSKLARQRGPIPAELHVPTRREHDEAAVLAYLDEHGQVKNSDVQALLGVGEDKARRALNRLRDRGVIVLGSKYATGRSVSYVRAPEA